jgi:cobalt/nickel transport protein
MSRKLLLNIGIIICGLLIVLLQILISTHFSGHIGTDDKSIDIIKEIAPGYKPWIGNIWEHSNNRIETVLFAIQASLGLGIIIFYILKQRNKIKSSSC